MSPQKFVPRPEKPRITKRALRDGEEDERTPCTVCGEKPTVHPTRLCGPCATGESDAQGDP